jgi:hypothetical protein
LQIELDGQILSRGAATSCSQIVQQQRGAGGIVLRAAAGHDLPIFRQLLGRQRKDREEVVLHQGRHQSAAMGFQTDRHGTAAEALPQFDDPGINGLGRLFDDEGFLAVRVGGPQANIMLLVGPIETDKSGETGQVFGNVRVGHAITINREKGGWARWLWLDENLIVRRKSPSSLSERFVGEPKRAGRLENLAKIVTTIGAQIRSLPVRVFFNLPLGRVINNRLLLDLREVSRNRLLVTLGYYKG